MTHALVCVNNDSELIRYEAPYVLFSADQAMKWIKENVTEAPDNDSFVTVYLVKIGQTTEEGSVIWKFDGDRPDECHEPGVWSDEALAKLLAVGLISEGELPEGHPLRKVSGAAAGHVWENAAILAAVAAERQAGMRRRELSRPALLDCLRKIVWAAAPDAVYISLSTDDHWESFSYALLGKDDISIPVDPMGDLQVQIESIREDLLDCFVDTYEFELGENKFGDVFTQECERCHKQFKLRYLTNGDYEELDRVCDCEEVAFFPVNGAPSISQWLNRRTKE